MADIQASKAAQAYQNTMNLARAGSAGQGGGDEGGFSGLVGQSLDGAVSAIKQGEHASLGSLVNNVGLDDLAVAVSNAEITLRTVVAIRDRIISAYQDIIKMPI